MILIKSELQKAQFESEVEHMKEQNWKIHRVRVLKQLKFKGCHIKEGVP